MEKQNSVTAAHCWPAVAQQPKVLGSYVSNSVLLAEWQWMGDPGATRVACAGEHLPLADTQTIWMRPGMKLQNGQFQILLFYVFESKRTQH